MKKEFEDWYKFNIDKDKNMLMKSETEYAEDDIQLAWQFYYAGYIKGVIDAKYILKG